MIVNRIINQYVKISRITFPLIIENSDDLFQAAEGGKGGGKKREVRCVCAAFLGSISLLRKIAFKHSQTCCRMSMKKRNTHRYDKTVFFQFYCKIVHEHCANVNLTFNDTTFHKVIPS